MKYSYLIWRPVIMRCQLYYSVLGTNQRYVLSLISSLKHVFLPRLRYRECIYLWEAATRRATCRGTKKLTSSIRWLIKHLMLEVSEFSKHFKKKDSWTHYMYGNQRSMQLKIHGNCINCDKKQISFPIIFVTPPFFFCKYSSLPLLTSMFSSP